MIDLIRKWWRSAFGAADPMDVIDAYAKVTADLRKDFERRERVMREQANGKPIYRVKAGSRRIYTPEQQAAAASYQRQLQAALAQVALQNSYQDLYNSQQYTHWHAQSSYARQLLGGMF